MNTIRTI